MKTLVEQIEESRNWARRYATVMEKTDLTKLTADELMRFSPDVEGVMPEIRRRLKLLEQIQPRGFVDQMEERDPRDWTKR